jgi:hypothetical protein
MKGKILGFTPSSGSGAIAAEDGRRFTFEASQWRSDKPIAAGTEVDFAPSGDAATEIYPIAASFAAPDLSALASSDVAQKLRGLAMTTLAFPLALLLLIATFMPALSTPLRSFSLWSLGGVAQMAEASPLFDSADSADGRLAEIEKERQELRAQLTARGLPMPSDAEIAAAPAANIFGETSYAGQFKRLDAESERLERAASDAHWRSLLSTALVLRYLVPLGACALMVLAWVGKPVARPSLGVGAVSILVALLVVLYRGALIGHPDKDSLGGMISAGMDAAISVGFGVYAIGLIGVALIAGGLGYFRNPMAAKA